MPFRPVNWQPLEVITSRKLNQMVENDEFLNLRKLRGAVRNIEPTGEPRQSPQYLKEALGVIAGYSEFTPGKEFPKDQTNKKVKPAFTREFNFPGQFFDPEFKPSVVCNIGTKRGIRKIVWTITRVNSGGFAVRIQELDENLDFERDMEYFITWIAMGVRISV